MKKILLGLLLATPIIASANNRTTVEKNADEMFSHCDTDGDGKISKDEYQKEKMDKFSKYDTNNDGSLSKEENEKMAVDMHDKLMGSEKKS